MANVMTLGAWFSQNPVWAGVAVGLLILAGVGVAFTVAGVQARQRDEDEQ